MYSIEILFLRYFDKIVEIAKMLEIFIVLISKVCKQ